VTITVGLTIGRGAAVSDRGPNRNGWCHGEAMCDASGLSSGAIGAVGLKLAGTGLIARS
jgi:hypothetical protein